MYDTADEQRAVAAAFSLLYEEDLDRADVMGVGYGTPFSDVDAVSPAGIVVWTRLGKQEKIKQAMPAAFNDLPVYVEDLAPPTH